MPPFFKPVAYYKTAGGLFVPQKTSVSLDGSTEEFAYTSATAMGVANTWSQALWIKPRTSIDIGYVSEVNGFTSSGENRLLWFQASAISFRVYLYDSAGANFKQWRWNTAAAFLGNVWNLVVLTWDGTDIVVHRDGVTQTLSQKITDNAGTMADPVDRRISIGGSVSQAQFTNYLYHSGGFWNSVLTEAEALSLYNGGDGTVVDWSNNRGSYVSSGNLQHWWRFGFNPVDAEMGADYETPVTGALNLSDNALNITSDDNIDDYPGKPFSPQLVSVDLNGVDEVLADELAGIETDINNAWTWAVWVKTDGPYTSEDFIFRRKGGNDVSKIDIRNFGASASDPLGVYIYGNDGVAIKQYHYNDLPVIGAWNLLVVTWDGTDMLLYSDGVLTAKDSNIADTTGTMDDLSPNWHHYIGTADSPALLPIPARFHSCAMWASVLTQAEVTRLYNGGNGTVVDWGNDNGNYVSSANLKHWWRLGNYVDDIGGEYGYTSINDGRDRVDLMRTATNIDATNVVADYPGI